MILIKINVIIYYKVKKKWSTKKRHKSVKKQKELDRSYDYADAYGFANAAANVGFVKRRARRKLRHDENKQLKAIKGDNDNG